MSKTYWAKRWISRREITDRKKWASAWRNNPEKMKLAQEKATKAAQISKARKRDRLLDSVRSQLIYEPMLAEQLKAVLRDFLKAHRKPFTKKAVKALTIRLTRYGALSYDPSSALWTIVN